MSFRANDNFQHVFPLLTFKTLMVDQPARLSLILNNIIHSNIMCLASVFVFQALNNMTEDRCVPTVYILGCNI